MFGRKLHFIVRLFIFIVDAPLNLFRGEAIQDHA